MKWILIVALLTCTFLLSWCSLKAEWDWTSNKFLIKPVESRIFKKNVYSLDCHTKYYTSTNIGDKMSIETNEWHESETLYVSDDAAKFFWADFDVIQDDDEYLIIMRTYEISGLTEVVTINKKSWIGFDVKTLWLWITWGPTSDTYIVSCSEV